MLEALPYRQIKNGTAESHQALPGSVMEYEQPFEPVAEGDLEALV